MRPGPHRSPSCVESPERIANWRPLVHWILAIPHFVIVYVLGIAGQVVAVVSWFVILFTGCWPEGLRTWVMRALRASLRLNACATLLTDRYPPLSFE